MPDEETYLKTARGIIINKSYGNINMILAADIPKNANFDVVLMVLEELRRSLLSYQTSCGTYVHAANEIAGYGLSMPKSLHHRLTDRAKIENCSFDILCVYGLSHFLTQTIK